MPRYAGMPTFLRLPVVGQRDACRTSTCCLCGVPFDGGSSYRPGARLGPPRRARRVGARARLLVGARHRHLRRASRRRRRGHRPRRPTTSSRRSSAIAVARRGHRALGRRSADSSAATRPLTLGVLRGIHRAKLKAWASCTSTPTATRPARPGAATCITAASFDTPSKKG